MDGPLYGRATMRLFLPVISSLVFMYSLRPLSGSDKPPVNATLPEQAGHGDAEAQLRLAIAFRDGKDGPRDYAQAMQWGHRAADQGFPAALDFIGYQYLRGWGVPENLDLAVGYFKASSGKSAQGMYNLGECYFSGRGVDLDMARAVDCWKHAGDMGHGRAAARVAMAFMDGEGADPDKDEAIRWASRAAELGTGDGCIVLGELRFQNGQLDAAKEAWQKGASQKDGDAGESASLLKLIEYRNHKSEPGKFAIVEGPHVHQGWNNCGATSTTMLARFQGSKINEWDYKRLCPGSPIGTGTDWTELLAASQKIGLRWKLVTFPADDKGFEDGTVFLRAQADAGRPVVIDFTYVGPEYPGGTAGHTLLFTGYIDGGKQVVLRNPAIPTPGLVLMSDKDFERFWRSSSYTQSTNGVIARPAIVIEE
jgi:hypothetical protein